MRKLKRCFLSTDSILGLIFLSRLKELRKFSLQIGNFAEQILLQGCEIFLYCRTNGAVFLACVLGTRETSQFKGGGKSQVS